MAQKGVLPAIRIPPPGLSNSSSFRLSKYHIPFTPSTPSPVIYQRPSTGRLWVAILLQVSSIYAVYRYLTGNGQPTGDQPSLVQFATLTFVGASLVLGFLQHPWKGRAISFSQGMTLLISGALVAISFLLRMRGLADVGPLETILAEYAGAVVGKVLITVERKVHGVRTAKFRGALAFLVGLLLLSQGWAISPCSPLSSLFVPVVKSRRIAQAKLGRASRIGFTAESRAYLAGKIMKAQEEDCSKYVRILAPLFAGLLASMQKLVPSVTSLVNVPQKRVQVLTYVAAGVVLVPVMLFQVAFFGRGNGGSPEVGAIWPLFSMITFGMVVAFYGESFAEEQLLIFPLSPFHFFATVCSVCFFELVYGSNFSLLGFVVCSGILALGVRAAAFICGGRDLKGLSEKEEYAGSSLISMIKTPLYHIWTDVKTRKIAMFLLLNTSFMFVEFLYGFLSNSLGLISDACHMLFDCAALAIGLYASYISRLAPNSSFNFGYGRFEVLSGYANAVFLILVASLIVLESLERLLEPPEMSTESLLLVSVGGLIVNIVGLVFFHEAHHHSHGGGPCTHSHAHRSHSHKEGAPLKSNWVPDGVTSFSPRFPSSPAFADRREEALLLNFQGPGKVSDYDHDHHLSRISDSDSSSFSSTNAALNHGHSANGMVGHHQQSYAGGPSQQSNDLSQHHSDSAYQHHDRSGVPSGDKSSGHGHDFPVGELIPLQCLEHHGSQHDQRNPFVEEASLHSPHRHFGDGSFDHHLYHHHGHRHFDSLERPFVQQSGSVTNGQSEIDNVDLVENVPGSSLTNLSKYPGSEHQHHGESGFGDEKDQDQPQNRDRGMGTSESKPMEQVTRENEHRHDVQFCGESGLRLGHNDHDQNEDHGHNFVQHKKHEHDRDQHHQHDHNNQDFHQYRGDLHHRHTHGHRDHDQEQSERHEHHQHSHDDHDGHERLGYHHHPHDAHNHHEQHSHHHPTHGDHDQHDHHGHHHPIHNDDHHKHHGHHHHHHEDHNCDHGHHHDHHHHHSHDGHDEHIDHDHIDHNMEGIFLHILADTLGSVGVVISTLLIKYKGWAFTDPVCSIFISILIVSSVLPLVRNSAELLLQRVPRSSEGRIQKALRKVEEVEGVHDWHKLHVWSYSNTALVGTLRLHAAVGTDKQLVRNKVSGIFMEAGIMDSTVEVEDLEDEAGE